jgi:electron transfer flavoprotein alpha subunit
LVLELTASHALGNKESIAMFAAARTSVLRSARLQLRQTQSHSHSHAAWARLASTLAVLEQKEGKLNIASLAAITAGTKLGGSITAFVAGSGVKSVAEEAAKAKGIEKVIYVDNGAYDRGLAENWAPLLVENIKKGGYTHILTGHSAFGKNLMPRVAALLDVQQISDITEIESEDSTWQQFHTRLLKLTQPQHSSVPSTPATPS